MIMGFGGLILGTLWRPMLGSRRPNYYGGNRSFTVNANDWFGVLSEGTVHQSKSSIFGASVTERVTAYRFGPRFTMAQGGPVSLFANVIVGGARVTDEGKVGSLKVSDHINGFSAAAGGGFDARIKPWLHWRTQLDYNYLRFVGYDFNGVRVGTGLAFRFGRS
jgi:hypothetical protein